MLLLPMHTETTFQENVKPFLEREKSGEKGFTFYWNEPTVGRQGV